MEASWRRHCGGEKKKKPNTSQTEGKTHKHWPLRRQRHFRLKTSHNIYNNSCFHSDLRSKMGASFFFFFFWVKNSWLKVQLAAFFHLHLMVFFIITSKLRDDQWDAAGSYWESPGFGVIKVEASFTIFIITSNFLKKSIKCYKFSSCSGWSGFTYYNKYSGFSFSKMESKENLWICVIKTQKHQCQKR